MYTMSYFFDQDQTLRIAKGEDLFHFKDCNQNRPVLDLRPLGNIIRDPYILKDAQGIYRLFLPITGTATPWDTALPGI